MGSGDTLGDSTLTRKLTDDQCTLIWKPLVSPRTTSFLKRARTTSLTVCPSLIFSPDSATDCNSPWQEPTKKLPIMEPYSSGSIHSSFMEGGSSLNLEGRSEMLLSSGFSLVDGVLSDDDMMFSEFIWSPSPGCLTFVSVRCGDSPIVSTAKSTTNC